MIYAFDDYEVDTRLYELRRAGVPVALEPQVFTVLAFLVEHGDRVVTKNELIDHVWPERFISETALTSRLMAARKAIGDSGQEQRYIRTVHGRGYRFTGRVAVGDGAVTPSRAPAATQPAPPERRAETQDIRFCKMDDGVRIACATSGSGPPLVKTANWLSHLEFDWRSPVWRHWISELSRDHTLVRYDERGCGLSDRDIEPSQYSVDAWVRDLESVVDTLGLERFPLLGISQGGPVAITYTVRHPERVSHLILYGTYAEGRWLRGKTEDERAEQEALATLMRLRWGRDDPSFRQMFANEFIPGASEEQKRWFNDLCRVSASSENAERFYRAFGVIDVKPLLARVPAPTLVLHGTDDKRVPIDQSRMLATEIPGARFVALETANHILLEDEPAWPLFLAEVRRFLGDPASASGTPAVTEHAVVVTQTEEAAELARRIGGESAGALLAEFEAEVRGLVSLHGGGDLRASDGRIIASFKSSARALECAVAVLRRAALFAELRGVPLVARVGVHAGAGGGPEAGDAETLIATQIAAAGRGGEILVSDAVRERTNAKGFQFGESRTLRSSRSEPAVRVHEVDWTS